MLLGFGLGLALHAISIALLHLFGKELYATHLVLIGATQLLYLAPAAWICHRRRRPGLVAGLAVVAGLTLLLNAACWGLAATTFQVGAG